MRMPEHDGDWLLKKLQAKKYPVIIYVYTGFFDEYTEKELKKLGAAEVLQKPIGLDRLKELLLL